MRSYCFKLVTTFICIFTAAAAQAQITADGTLGKPGALTGPHYRIESELGKQVGGNLFHSFGQFNVNTGESATFTGPDSVQNIISRVTGGGKSLIDGWLRSEIPGANLYLLNPGGVLFGKNAKLDIGGSFHVSTADYLRLGENGRFDATQPEISNLSVDPPSAFGFLSDSPKGISAEGVLLANPGKTLSLTGGDVVITGGALAAEGGQVHVAATASPGEVIPTDSGPEITSSGNLGKISLSQGAQINVTGDPSGDIYIRGGQFEIKDEGTSLISETGNADGGDIDIRVSEDIAISDGAVLSAAGFGDGKGGNISLNAANLKMTGGGIANAEVAGAGPGGAISVTAGSVEISGYGQSYKSGLYAETGGAGDAGSISVSADEFTLSDNGTISALTVGAGNGGDVSLNVKKLDINSGGTIDTSSRKSGAGGNIAITANESVSISGPKSSLIGSLDASAYSSGNGGQISVVTENITLSAGGTIQNLSAGEGHAGDVSVNAGRLDINSGGTVDTSSRKSGAGGNIAITANESVSISGKGDLLSNLDASAYGSGDGGNISVITEAMVVSDDAVVQNSSVGKGRSGDISLNADRLEISRGGQILTNVFSSGQGGNISISCYFRRRGIRGKRLICRCNAGQQRKCRQYRRFGRSSDSQR